MDQESKNPSFSWGNAKIMSDIKTGTPEDIQKNRAMLLSALSSLMREWTEQNVTCTIDWKNF